MQTNSYPLKRSCLHTSCAGDEDRHGYGIMREVKQQSDRPYTIGPGTLYDNLQKLMERGFVEESSRRPKDEDPRRRYYTLTRLGRTIRMAEIRRLQGIVEQASGFLGVAKPRRA